MKIANTVSAVVSVSLVLSLIGPIAALADSPAAVNLGTAGNYAILAKTGISTTGTTSIVGDIGVSPAAASYITGFGLILPAASAFSTSALITGKAYASDYAVPIPSNLTTAVSDMETAYTDAAGRAYTTYNLGSGNISGRVLPPGVYKWRVGVTITSDVTLSGGADDIWIFQIPGTLNVSPIVKVVLSGGAQASNIFWQVAGQTTIGVNAVFNGNILDQTAIVLNTGAVLNGRALAQSAVTLDANTVTKPTPVVSTSTPTPTPSPVACTMEALQCSDGSYVSRQGPTCAFAACPVVTSQTSNGSGPTTTSTVSSPAVPASGLSSSQIQSILGVLASFNADAVTIAKVKASLEGTTTGSVTSAAVHVFKENLTAGSLGSEVKALQEFLNAHGYTVATSGAGSLGNETTKFGPATKAALMKYQQAKGITPVAGYFGAKTRAAINTGE